MKNTLAFFTVALALAASGVQMASQPWVTNRIAEAESRIVAQIPSADLTPATNYTDAAIQGLAGQYLATTGGVVEGTTEFNFLNAGITHLDELTVSPGATSLQNLQVNGGLTVEGNLTAGAAVSGGEGYFGDTYINGALTVNDEQINPLNLITTDNIGEYVPQPDLSEYATKSALAAVSNEAALVHLLYTASNQLPFSVSTNNPAFVAAVTNCPVAIAAGDAEALTEWGIYGGGGTIGALLAALAAAVAALKKKKMPLYPVGGTGNPVNATYDSGVLTVSPFAMAAYAPTASAAFSVAMGALPNDMEAGKARDAVLVIDCSALSEGDEPTVTWDTHFHPRTDTATDLAIVEAGKRAVFYISEYAAGEFAVGGWVETEGGNT